MPGPGGAPDKLGNSYEAVWTVEAAIDVVTGRFLAITVEAFGEESKGVEFHLENLDNTFQFHSLKRQKQGGDWSVANLCRADKTTGRSILGDLFSKRAKHSNAQTRFVSSTGANELRELAERAEAPRDATELRRILSAKLRAEFDGRIVPLCGGNAEMALAALKSLEVIPRGHKDLVRIVERRIDELFFRHDRSPLKPDDVRRMIAEFIHDNLGSRIDGDRFRELFRDKGIGSRDWKTDTTVRDTVATVNRRYLSVAEAELVNSAQISRDVVGQIIETLSNPSSRGLLLVAPGGFGKSCILAQCVSRLTELGTPHLCLRIDSFQPCSTPRQLGLQLDLPASPAVVLAAMADNTPSVLVVDQLDAMSLVSGRNSGMWEVFRELCDEVRMYPHMKMILACRNFDLDHDHRLRSLGAEPSGFTRVPVDKLSEAEIRKSLEFAGHDRLQLNERQIEILGVPFHLLLFLQGGPARSFTSVGELYDRYWGRKRKKLRERLGRESHWNEILDALTKEMSERQVLFAPALVTDTWSEDAKAMVSEHVLVEVASQRLYRFFHESFFDYAYARRFCATGRGVLDFLESSEQHLFRRAQVRQILAYRRENDFRQYKADMQALIESPKVRFHIKRMIASELARIDEPRPEEWSVIAPHLLDGDLSRYLATALRNHAGWFDLMDSLQVVQNWLASDDPRLNNAAIFFLEAPTLQDSRSSRIAELILPYAHRSDADWKVRIRRIVSWGKAHKSSQMAAIYLGLIERGAFDDHGSDVIGDDFWSEHHDAGENAPKFIIDVLATWFDRVIEQVDDGESWDIFDKCDQNRSHVGAMYVGQAAAKEPEYFVEKMLPRVTATILRTTCHRGGEVRNRAWPHLSNHGDPFTIDEAILLHLRKGLQHLAQNNVPLFRKHAEAITPHPHQTFAYLLLRSWAENPQEFADDCASYLVADQRRLNIGYGTWTGDAEATGESAISRLALTAISPHCSKELFERLESQIIGYCDAFEKQHPKWRGYAELLVLRSFDNSRISERTALRIEELERKFPKLTDAIVKEDATSGLVTVGSPIPQTAAEIMNDEQWIAAMQKYDGSTDPFKGGPLELSRSLADFARTDRNRFASLALRIPDTMNPMYFSAILDGICGRNPNLSAEDQELDKKAIEAIPTGVFLGVIDRLHSLPARPCGSAIAACVKQLANRQLPKRLFEIISHYANDDADPDAETWQEKAGRAYYYGGDPHAHGINCVRGQAAEAVGALLFEDPSRLDHLRTTLARLSEDPIISVRTCAIDAFLPLLNCDRDLAVDLFLRASAGSAVICGTRTFKRFVKYAKYTHYSRLREVLHFALNSDNEEAVTNAAIEITAAELGEVEVGEDAAKVRVGSETMRKAAARVYAKSLSHEVLGNKCEQRLEEFFRDESKAVRKQVSSAFFQMRGPRLLELREFIRRFIESDCFAEETERLLYALEESRAELPDIVCRAAERTLDLLSETSTDRTRHDSTIAHSISALIVRQYEQATGNAIKTHCLDLIDRMERAGYLGMDQELSRIDR